MMIVMVEIGRDQGLAVTLTKYPLNTFRWGSGRPDQSGSADDGF